MPALGLLLLPALLAACAGTPAPSDKAEPGTPPPAAEGPKEPGKAKIDTSKYGIFYPQFWEMSEEGPLIPALEEGNIPQGIAYWKEKGWLIISNYKDDKSPSTLMVVDAAIGEPVKKINLAEPGGSSYTGHAGGVAISGKHLWVSSEGKAWWMTLQSLADAKDGDKVEFGGVVSTVARASFTSFKDGVLWVGEFHLEPDYKTDASHKLTSPDGSKYGAWAVGYKLDPETDQIPISQPGPVTPDYILSIPDRVQGFTMTTDSIITSQSYGRGNDSKLTMYRRPDLSTQPHQTVAIGDREVPVWFLDSKTLAGNLHTLTAPPMAEGVDTDGEDRLFLLFESGANKYRPTAASPMDTIRIIHLDKWRSSQ
ncbi:MAG: hypothetical protein IMX01_10550 [Limnochordaceae bacterium]|nr:hypothetical protein [Limnochordaceae bacterium]